jgi:hypothetical protein
MAHEVIVENPTPIEVEKPDNVLFFPGVKSVNTSIEDDPTLHKIMRLASTKITDEMVIIGLSEEGSLCLYTQREMNNNELVGYLTRVISYLSSYEDGE